MPKKIVMNSAIGAPKIADVQVPRTTSFAKCSRIESLWYDGCKLPTRTGIYFANGTSFLIDIQAHLNNAPNSIPPFSLDDFWETEPDSTTFADITKSIKLPNGDFLCGGECSFGEEGFFALLNSEKNLIWVTYIACLNPFNQIHVLEGYATIISTSKVEITVDINSPINMKIKIPD